MVSIASGCSKKKLKKKKKKQNHQSDLQQKIIKMQEKICFVTVYHLSLFDSKKKKKKKFISHCFNNKLDYGSNEKKNK